MDGSSRQLSLVSNTNTTVQQLHLQMMRVCTASVLSCLICWEVTSASLLSASCWGLGVQISEIWFGFRYRISELNPNRPKIWHPYRRFSDRNCMQSTVQIKSDKITLLAFTVQIKIKIIRDIFVDTLYNINLSFTYLLTYLLTIKNILKEEWKQV